MFRNTIAFANIVNGTGSLVLTDDLWRSTTASTWAVERRRRMAADRPRLQSDLPDAHAAARRQLDQRGLYPQHARAWQGYMTRHSAQRARRPFHRAWRKSKSPSNDRGAKPAARAPLRGAPRCAGRSTCTAASCF
jgi:hypothetical protein